jgi:hypothetical protein
MHRAIHAHHEHTLAGHQRRGADARGQARAPGLARRRSTTSSLSAGDHRMQAPVAADAGRQMCAGPGAPPLARRCSRPAPARCRRCRRRRTDRRAPPPPARTAPLFELGRPHLAAGDLGVKASSGLGLGLSAAQPASSSSVAAAAATTASGAQQRPAWPRRCGRTGAPAAAGRQGRGRLGRRVGPAPAQLGLDQAAVLDLVVHRHPAPPGRRAASVGLPCASSTSPRRSATSAEKVRLGAGPAASALRRSPWVQQQAGQAQPRTVRYSPRWPSAPPSQAGLRPRLALVELQSAASSPPCGHRGGANHSAPSGRRSTRPARCGIAGCAPVELTRTCRRPCIGLVALPPLPAVPGGKGGSTRDQRPGDQVAVLASRTP